MITFILQLFATSCLIYTIYCFGKIIQCSYFSKYMNRLIDLNHETDVFYLYNDDYEYSLNRPDLDIGVSYDNLDKSLAWNTKWETMIAYKGRKGPVDINS